MSEITIIENDILKAAISPVGAELKSLYMKQAHCPLVWEGDPGIWKDSAPWLFPVVGRLKNGGYEYKGNWYELEMHGFARKSLFEIENLSSNAVVYTLHQTTDTLHAYPWFFKFIVAYHLMSNALKMTVRVINTSDETMPFSVGAHPGFYTSHGDKLLFEEPEDMPIYRLDSASQLLATTSKEWFRGSELYLDPELFIDDALILRHPVSRSLTLIRSCAPHVRITFPQVPYLGLWSKARANMPYVCIEPWYGVDNTAEAKLDIFKKEAINMLNPGEEFSMDLMIEALPG